MRGSGVAAALLGVLFVASVAPPAAAQWSASSGTLLRSWHTSGGTGRDEITATQTFVPLRMAYTFPSGMQVALVTGGAASHLANATGSADLDGLRSFGLRLFAPLADQRVLAELALTPRSGKANLTADELRVAESLDLPLLGFGLRRYGSGNEVGGGVTVYALRQDLLRASIGVAGTTRGGFELVQGAGHYVPASEAAITAGFDWGTSDDGPPVRLDLAWRTFGVDRLDGKEVFAEGDQFESRIDGIRRSGDLVGRAWVRMVLKQDNQAPANSLVGAYRANSGNAYVLGASLDRPWGEHVRPGLLVEHVQVQRSDEFGRNGYVTGAGPVVTWALDENSSADASLTIYWGRLKGLAGGSDSGLTGLTFALGVRTRRPSR